MNIPLPRAFCLMVVYGTLTALPGAHAAENLIQNGDLEQDTTAESGQLPTGMTTAGQEKELSVTLAKYYLSQEEKSSGKNSLCIERLDDPRGFTRVNFTPDLIQVEGGKRYYFSCKIKSTAPNARVIMYVFGSNKMALPMNLPDSVTTTQGALIGYEGAMLNFDSNKAENPDGFNKVEWTFTVPPEGVYLGVTLDFSHNALGKAWYDDFELRALD